MISLLKVSKKRSELTQVYDVENVGKTVINTMKDG